MALPLSNVAAFGSNVPGVHEENNAAPNAVESQAIGNAEGPEVDNENRDRADSGVQAEMMRRYATSLPETIH